MLQGIKKMSTLTSRFLHYRTIRSVDVNLLISDHDYNNSISRGYIPNQTINQSNNLAIKHHISAGVRLNTYPS
jgi:hypothetical protein